MHELHSKRTIQRLLWELCSCNSLFSLKNSIFAAVGERNRRFEEAFFALSFLSKSPISPLAKEQRRIALALLCICISRPTLRKLHIPAAWGYCFLCHFGEGVWRYLIEDEQEQVSRFSCNHNTFRLFIAVLGLACIKPKK